MRLKKADLMQLVGKNIEVTFERDICVSGKLGFTEEFSEKYGWRKPGYFTVANFDFKVSHIKALKVIN